MSGLSGAAISALCLFNLPWFYELGRTATVWILLMSVLLLGLVAFFFTKWFVLPYYHGYTGGSNLWSIGILGAVLLFIFLTSSPFYWAVPQLQRVSICYISAQPGDSMQLFEIHDSSNQREYPPQAVGYQKYPIQIAANSCIQGSVIALINLKRGEPDHGLAATVEQKSASESVRISINRQEEDFALNDHDGLQKTEKVSSLAGIHREAVITAPWGAPWFKVLKWGSIALSSAYLALVLFGISETILSSSEPS